MEAFRIAWEQEVQDRLARRAGQAVIHGLTPRPCQQAERLLLSARRVVAAEAVELAEPGGTLVSLVGQSSTQGGLGAVTQALVMADAVVAGLVAIAAMAERVGTS